MFLFNLRNNELLAHAATRVCSRNAVIADRTATGVGNNDDASEGSEIRERERERKTERFSYCTRAATMICLRRRRRSFEISAGETMTPGMRAFFREGAVNSSRGSGRGKRASFGFFLIEDASVTRKLGESFPRLQRARAISSSYRAK